MKEQAIICVDDDRLILGSLGEQLKRCFGKDYDIELVDSGIEALALCAELVADNIDIPLVISDRNMLGMSGDKLLIQLHCLYPQTLKILLTGETDADTVGSIVNAGALYRYIAKPWNETDLILTVKEALRRYQQERQLNKQNKLLKTTNEQLEQSLGLLLATLEATADGILVLDSLGKVVRYNQKFRDLWGITEEIATELDTKKIFNQVLVPLTETDNSELQTRQAKFKPSNYSLVKLANGKVLECYCQVQRLQDSPIGRVWSFRDVTDRHQTEAIIKHQAFHDALTDLPNRALFDLNLAKALTEAHTSHNVLAVVFLDLDRFKIINDTLGHAIGDLLLKSVVKRLLNCVREGDTLSRWGGDEFTILLTNIRCRDDASSIATRILEALQSPFEIGDHCLHVTSSLGIAMYPHDGEDASTLLKNADAALYQAKDRGRNNYQHYNLTLNSQAGERFVLENKLYYALEREEFILYYQPIVNVTTGKIVKMEALLRWQDPERGLIPPNLFIPLAEENGAIVPIGKWVLETACTQARTWQKMGLPPLCMAVNLSARQFQQPNLGLTIAEILQQTGLPPSDLELEITETVMMQDINLVEKVLLELHEMGICLAMDDFGTGYSSLSYLKQFAFDTLKIDRFFIKNSLENPKNAAIVNAIIQLGQGLNLKVVAEGVETKELKNLLQNWQCQYMQGYLFSRPLAAIDATKLLETHFVNAKISINF